LWFEGIALGNPVFVNTLGHSCGLLLFGVLIFLLLKSWDKTGARPQISTIAAASLALLWNAGSLVGLALRSAMARSRIGWSPLIFRCSACRRFCSTSLRNGSIRGRRGSDI
jgi:hypothetical protein